MTQPKKNVAIVGARGYSGLELARILLKHPEIQLKVCFATDAQWSLSDYLSSKEASAVPVHEMHEFEALLPQFDAVFLATPADVSLKLAPRILAGGKHAIDLSGAFRIEPQAFEKWYGEKHSAPELIEAATYGLVPFAAPSPNKGPTLVSNPGCYATSVLLALIPLLKSGCVEADSIVIDAKSGTTGAGRKASERLLFSEVEGECLPYKIGKHQHWPEICAYLEKFSGVKAEPAFTTHLLATRRGILSSIYAKLSPALARLDRKAAMEKVSAAYTEAYAGYPLVSFGPAEPRLMSLKRVVGTARAQLSFEIADGRLYLFSTLDNLLKGAASQAVENLNRVFDFPVNTGLMELEGLT